MSPNREMLENVVVAALLSVDRPIDEQEIADRVKSFRQIVAVSDEEADAVIRSLQARLRIRMDLGVKLVGSDYRPWLAARKPHIKPFYWDRYKQHLLLHRRWPLQVTQQLDRVADEILDLFGNPAEAVGWSRRGLVMGNVQSGKTAAYIALCNKAADAGYRLIILLTGTLENLRRQTQERLDAGFVGLDSSGILARERMRRAYGVGVIDGTRNAAVLTSTKNDFSSILVNQLGFTLRAFQEPVLMVVKKNTRILENLHTWLRTLNADAGGMIDLPMLLIDDEADNASVNTNRPEADPTGINRHIRSILTLFTRTTYVGFTATPFANIFIDPESRTEMLDDDLFPRDFMYVLDPPTNYVGPSVVFDEDSAETSLREINDSDELIPPRHRRSLLVPSLPSSLRRAIYLFFLADTVRDLRAEGKTHRSMLVNVSPWTDVQMQIFNLIVEEVESIQSGIRNFSQLSETDAIRNPEMAKLREIWHAEFNTTGFEWGKVQKSLYGSALQIVVRAVNQRTGVRALDYFANRDNGLRVIAVGGNSLSRGLTLEGLCTSYFLRNSQMSDTLLQMGRWFGYRDGYADLCRLWLRDEAVHWYAHIAESVEELREEIRRMNRENKTPLEFGLKVREHPDFLLVTARNKMRHAKTIVKEISLSCKLIETAALRYDTAVIRVNAQATRAFLDGLLKSGQKREDSPHGNHLWRSVDRNRIADFVRDFRYYPFSYEFNNDTLPEFIRQSDDPKMQSWDVVLLTARGGVLETPHPELQINLRKRTVALTEGRTCILVSGKKRRVGSRGDEKEGIDPSVIEKVEAEWDKGKNIPDWAYREQRPRPLLLINVINPMVKQGDDSEEPLDTGKELLIAISLSFPQIISDRRTVTYKVNTVEWRNLFESEIDEDAEDIDEN